MKHGFWSQTPKGCPFYLWDWYDFGSVIGDSASISHSTGDAPCGGPGSPGQGSDEGNSGRNRRRVQRATLVLGLSFLLYLLPMHVDVMPEAEGPEIPAAPTFCFYKHEKTDVQHDPTKVTQRVSGNPECPDSSPVPLLHGSPRAKAQSHPPFPCVEPSLVPGQRLKLGALPGLARRRAIFVRTALLAWV